jgi:hypothetical protein
MDQRIAEIVKRIGELEEDLQRELTEAGDRFGYHFDKGKARFERSAIAAQRQLRRTLFRFIAEADWLVALTAPVIYSLIVPLALLDLFITIYQRVCFPIYGVDIVRRGEYVVVDRHRLAYLNLLEKLNCAYCGYGNGVIAYAREIAARTERYWCGIKHAKRVKGAHRYYYDYPDYGDAEGYRENEKKIGEKRIRNFKRQGDSDD